MQTRILFFGPLRDIAQGAERALSVPGEINTAEALIDWLCGDDAVLRSALSHVGVKVCIDKKVIGRDETFSAPQEIAFLPPFSGG